MVKKGILIGAGVLVLLGLLFGRDGLTHAKTLLGMGRDALHDAVPVEFEISRASQMIKDLDPEIHRNMHVIAKEEVEVAHLREQLGVAEKNLAKNKGDIERLTADLQRGDSNFV